MTTGSHFWVNVLGVFVACRAAIGWFSMDTPGARATPTGRTHTLLAAVAFFAIAVAAGALSRSLARTVVDAAPAAVSGILCLIMLALLLAMPVSRRVGAHVYGLLERLFYAAMMAWLILVAITVRA